MPSYFNCAQLFVTPWTVASQAPLSMDIYMGWVKENSYFDTTEAEVI